MFEQEKLAEPRPCCKHLRCKSMYYRPDERAGLLHDEDAMGYWCARTNLVMGPDNDVARHQQCQAGRDCFECGPVPNKFRA
jgi:hypothetical protein